MPASLTDHIPVPEATDFDVHGLPNTNRLVYVGIKTLENYHRGLNYWSTSATMTGWITGIELSTHRSTYDPALDRVDTRGEAVGLCAMLVLAVVDIFLLRFPWKPARKVGVESVARTADALTAAAERGHEQGQLGNR